MNNSPKTKRSVRKGAAAVAAAAALLAILILFLVSAPGEDREPTTVPTETTEPVSLLPANPYGVEDFTYRDGYLACSAANAQLGLDVSAHQGSIDWAQVAEAGMEFAMVRIGYRGNTSGGIYEDETARDNLTGAKNAGLDVGVYFYSQAISPEEAAQEAAFCLAFLQDYEIDMPVVFDWEYVSEDARTGAMDRNTLTECAIAFCDAIAEAGYTPMVYFNPHIGDTLLDLEALVDYPWWLAMYSDRMDYPYAVAMWQYTHAGTVPGISGSVDINLYLPG